MKKLVHFTFDNFLLYSLLNLIDIVYDEKCIRYQYRRKIIFSWPVAVSPLKEQECVLCSQNLKVPDHFQGGQGISSRTVTVVNKTCS